MSKYLVILIFATALFGVSYNARVLAQSNQHTTEPDQSTQSDEISDEAAPPDTSDQTDQSEDSDADQPGDETDQPGNNEASEPEAQDR